VSNVTGRPVRARVLVLPGAGADAAWFQVVGEPERTLPVAGSATVDVALKVSEKAPAGAASFALGAALEEAPDRVVSSPTVAFQVPEGRKPPFPWWIVIVAVVALLVLAGGGILIYFLTRGDTGAETVTTPSATPTPTPTVELFAENAFTLRTGDAMVDFEGPELWTFTYCKFLPEADLCFYDQDVLNSGVPAGEPLYVSSATNAGVAIAPDGDYETCVEELSDLTVGTSATVSDVSTTTYVCFITGDRRYALLEVGPQGEGVPDRRIRYIVWEGTA
jgi:hypothetical protein